MITDAFTIAGALILAWLGIVLLAAIIFSVMVFSIITYLKQKRRIK